MTWQSTSFIWPTSAQQLQNSAESLLAQVPSSSNEATSRIQSLEGQVTFSRSSLSNQAEALLALRTDLNHLLIEGQVLCVHPYQYDIGTQTENGHHLMPDEAVSVLANKLGDAADKHHPKGELYVLGWMLAENTLSKFADVTSALFDVVNISELGMVARRVNKERSLAFEKMTQPESITQPRFKPSSHFNQAPLRDVERWQGAQLAQIESLAASRQTPVDKLTALAAKRTAQLENWSQSLNALKQSGTALYKFEANGSSDVIAAQLKKSQMPSRAHSYTFACLFISPEPLTFLSELFV